MELLLIFHQKAKLKGLGKILTEIYWIKQSKRMIKAVFELMLMKKQSFDLQLEQRLVFQLSLKLMLERKLMLDWKMELGWKSEYYWKLWLNLKQWLLYQKLWLQLSQMLGWKWEKDYLWKLKLLKQCLAYQLMNWQLLAQQVALMQLLLLSFYWFESEIDWKVLGLELKYWLSSNMLPASFQFYFPQRCY